MEKNDGKFLPKPAGVPQKQCKMLLGFSMDGLLPVTGFVLWRGTKDDCPRSAGCNASGPDQE